ncbi:ARC6/PARC6 family protein [Gloeobacter violaceus]|uniref:Glr3481 protein n=1 Tax=Gloeobacter violaceus (strain ATCC 29082 / PCC 7421) TaxID=251221 RepID=Q7NFP3_GLOVI|nr:ARC6/PARC6 family protein [Gloeobacter violaceus]BAC91422.1 glr3481 [Gloeobacter violaceus PCC 7421]
MDSASSLSLPLSYYQILGVPPQCTYEQVEPAFADRLAQAPRREFSAAVRSAREHWLREACTALGDPVRRELYHREGKQGLLLDSSHAAVGLLFLYELGEYQTLIERQREALAVADQPDTRLVLALAHQALAQEAYRQGNLTLAHLEVEEALEILRGGDCLKPVQQELQTLLKRWRPERILQLLAGAADPPSPQRQEGMALLAALLAEREGIEGDGNDQSGLSREEFVQFLQYLRLRLTVAEQQELFEREAARPSPAAQYLAAQAQLACGFTEGSPQCVRRARGHLIKLVQRQDVNLELAVCALLLGQVEEAQKNIERSAEEQAVDYIKNLSQDSPDLLPGLCRYTDLWLAEEVFPGFRDRRSGTYTLKAYFAHPEVRAFLDDPQPAPAPAPEPRPARVIASGASSGTIEPGRLLTPVGAEARRRRANLLSPQAWSVAAALVAIFLLGSGWLLTQRQSRPEPAPAARPVAPPVQAPAPIAAAPAPPQAAAPTATAAGDNQPPTDAQIAAMLKNWQTAKQQALGPEHRTAQMQTMLTGSPQRVWQQKVEQSRQAGEYWKFSLKDLKIEQVADRRPDRVAVTAQVTEVANLYTDNQLRPSRSYDRPYRVRYSLVKAPAGWRIEEMKVLL